MKAQYAILRFAKYKGPEIGHIESHNERTKEKYASNPDIDPERTHLNFHLVAPADRYRKESKRQIDEAGCRTRKDSVRVVEALFTVSPEFFKGKKRSDVKAFYEYALEFMKQERNAGTSVLYSTHYIEEAEFLCDRIIMVHKGKIIAQGTPQELRNMTNTNNLRDTFLALINEQEVL